jgi:hypothetical protein
MRRLALALLAGCLLAQWPAPGQAQERSRAERQAPRSGPHERRESLTRERGDQRERRREQRFTPAEREKLRQDLLDANRDLKRRR